MAGHRQICLKMCWVFGLAYFEEICLLSNGSVFDAWLGVIEINRNVIVKTGLALRSFEDRILQGAITLFPRSEQINDPCQIASIADRIRTSTEDVALGPRKPLFSKFSTCGKAHGK